MTVVDLSKPSCEPFFKTKTIKKKKSAAERREGMSAKHLALIRLLPCCICRGPGGQAHHLKLGTGERGMSLRSTDKNALPMCHEDHLNGIERAGSRNEHSWFQKRGVSPLDLAAALWLNTGDFDKMSSVLYTHMSNISERD